MSRNLYNRFINAFKDENEITSNEKRPPLISDEKLEDTFKTIKNGINNIKSTNSEEQKSSRFQRWIIHYLKAPFQKWETKTNDEQINPNIKEDEEESIDLSSSSESDEDDEDEDDDFSETDDDNIIKQISSKDDEDSDEDEEDDNKNLVTKVCVFNLIKKIKYHFYCFSYLLQLLMMMKIQLVNLMKMTKNQQLIQLKNKYPKQ
jgi:hypothetical protein